MEKKIKTAAREIGFDLVGIAPAALPPEDQVHLQNWLEKGRQGAMGYMENPDRVDIRRVYPWAKSVISLGVYYLHETDLDLDDPRKGKISCYAWGEGDYHNFMKDKLSTLAAMIEAETGEQCEVASDSFPIFERAYAYRAGLGWRGKNTCLIHQGGGSFFFLGEVISQARLKVDSPAPFRCGTCTRCIDACPTDALVAPFELDARRCISYLTIEYRSEIPEELSREMDNLIFGCDICQEVCPWNWKPQTSGYDIFTPRDLSYKLSDFGQLLDGGFNRLYGDTAVSRSRRRGFMRNIIIAMENSGLDYYDFLARAADDYDETVSYHARRALRIQKKS